MKGVVMLGVASLRFNGLMTLLGVAHHTGQVRGGRGRQRVSIAVAAQAALYGMGRGISTLLAAPPCAGLLGAADGA